MFAPDSRVSGSRIANSCSPRLHEMSLLRVTRVSSCATCSACAGPLVVVVSVPGADADEHDGERAPGAVCPSHLASELDLVATGGSRFPSRDRGGAAPRRRRSGVHSRGPSHTSARSSFSADTCSGRNACGCGRVRDERARALPLSIRAVRRAPSGSARRPAHPLRCRSSRSWQRETVVSAAGPRVCSDELVLGALVRTTR